MKLIHKKIRHGVDADGHPFMMEIEEPVLHPPLIFYKLDPSAGTPEFATDYAGCFDLQACLSFGQEIMVYSSTNEKTTVSVGALNLTPRMAIAPGERALIPTGLIFDIPVGYKIDMYSRSGLASKQAMVLANGVGKIDSDYVEQTYVLLFNLSAVNLWVSHGDRIAQAEMCVDIAYKMVESSVRPRKKGNRDGGLGSTGV